MMPFENSEIISKFFSDAFFKIMKALYSNEVVLVDATRSLLNGERKNYSKYKM